MRRVYRKINITPKFLLPMSLPRRDVRELFFFTEPCKRWLMLRGRDAGFVPQRNGVPEGGLRLKRGRKSVLNAGIGF